LNPYTRAWLSAFGATVVVELGVATPLLAPTGSSRARRMGVVLLANLATHPVVWFVFPGFSLSETERLVLSELWAVVVESLAYALVWPKIRPWRAVAAGALANGASLGAGLALRALGVRL
jgi:hypothetical protein